MIFQLKTMSISNPKSLKDKWRSHYNNLLGMTLLMARTSYPREIIREVFRDGKALPLTTGLNITRINVKTDDGVIIELDGLY